MRNPAHLERRALLKLLCAGIADDPLLSDKRKRDMRHFYRRLVDDAIRDYGADAVGAIAKRLNRATP